MKPARDYHDDLLHDLKDPREAIAYLNAALEEGDKEAFLLAVRHVVEAQGSMTQLARVSKLHRVSLYKILSKRGNPGIDSLMSVLDAIGARLCIAPQRRHRNVAAQHFFNSTLSAQQTLQ